MNRRHARRPAALAALALAAAAATTGCAGPMAGSGWTTLVDGSGRGLENFARAGGDANWATVDGTLQATAGGQSASYLVTRASYRNFEIRAEFWASDDANSGIFFRCLDSSRITDETCYEANIFDQRPDQTYATGAIVKVAAVAQPAPKAGGKWNTYHVTANGTRLTVVLNGAKTIDVDDAKFASGPIALQWGRGTIRWRNVQLRPL